MEERHITETGVFMTDMANSILTPREQFVEAVISRAGCPYRWGGIGDLHFDCAGLVKWAMRHIGKTAFPDVNVEGLYDMFHPNKVLPTAAPIGSLFLYSPTQNANQLEHVMICTNIWPNGKRILIGASGGDHTTLNDDIAYNQKAFVYSVWGDFWKSALMFAVDPFAGEA